MASAAKDLRYNHRNAVYGSLAYDLDRELRERELGHAGEAPLQREVALERPKVRSVSKVQVRQRQHLSAFSVVGFAAVAALAVLVLMSYIQLTALSSETVALKKQLSALETENVTLTAQYERMFDMATVKEVASAAGMSKPGSSQIYYVDLSDGDSAAVYQKEDPGILTKIAAAVRHSAASVKEYFG